MFLTFSCSSVRVTRPLALRNGPSSYTANGWVFQDGTNSNYQGLSQSGIRDGASMTLMISENLQLYSTTSGGTVSGGTAGAFP